MPLTTAVLDANVLVPVSLTDTLLRTAEHRRYVPRWSDRILDEVVRNVARVHPQHGVAGATRRVAFMKAAFPEAMVENWHELEGEMINDPKDRHVLAAAVTGSADIIVTNNVVDFPASACDPYDISVVRADGFLCEIWSEDLDMAATMVEEQAADLRNHTVDSLLDVLAVHAPAFVARLRAELE